MRLYHFLKACYAIDDVEKKRVKISLWMDVNDPWELKPFDLSDARNLRALEEFKTKMSKQFSFVSLCKHWRSPLMWAHYAERHQGVALGFEVTDAFCTPIKFVPNVYLLPTAMPQQMGTQRLNDGRRVIDVMLDTKFDGWSYEEEVRVFANQDGSNTENGIEFYPFSADFALREVILGEKCPLPIAQFRASVPSMDSLVRVIRARRAVHDFCLEEDPNAS
jgi:hypothetical protein